MSISTGLTFLYCTTYAQPNDTHDYQGDNVEDCAFEPLAKARSSIEILIAISCSLPSTRLSASGEQSLLFRCRRIAGANCGSGISIRSLRFFVEERHAG
jgi:hypothetical protein